MFRKLVLGMALLVFSTLSIAQSQLDAIQARQQLHVCIWPDYYSISYKDPRSQKLSGIDIDLAEQLAEYLQVSLKFVESSFTTLRRDIESKTCDVAMFAIGITPERQEYLSFTQPYIASDIVAVTTKSNRYITEWDDIDQKGHVVAVAKKTLHEPLMQRTLKHATVITPLDTFSREQEVLSGRADLFIADFPYSLRLIETTNWAKLIEPTDEYHVVPYAWAVKKGDLPWLTTLNQFLSQIKENGQLLQAAKKYNLDPIVVLE